MWYLETCAIFVLVLSELGVGGTQLAAGHGNAEKKYLMFTTNRNFSIT